MKWYQMAGDWKQFTSMVKARWAKLTDGDLTTFGGSSNQLAALLREKYGYARDEAEREIKDFAQEHTGSARAPARSGETPSPRP